MGIGYPLPKESTPLPACNRCHHVIDVCAIFPKITRDKLMCSTFTNSRKYLTGTMSKHIITLLNISTHHAVTQTYMRTLYKQIHIQMSNIRTVNKISVSEIFSVQTNVCVAQTHMRYLYCSHNQNVHRIVQCSSVFTAVSAYNTNIWCPTLCGFKCNINQSVN